MADDYATGFHLSMVIPGVLWGWTTAIRLYATVNHPVSCDAERFRSGACPKPPLTPTGLCKYKPDRRIAEFSGFGGGDEHVATMDLVVGVRCHRLPVEIR